MQASEEASLLPHLSAACAALDGVAAQLDAWLGSLDWPSPRLGLLSPADLRMLLALPTDNPAAVQPHLPLLFKGALRPAGAGGECTA